MRHVNFNSNYRLGRSRILECPTCQAERFQYYVREVKERGATDNVLVNCIVYECAGCGAQNTTLRDGNQVVRSQMMLMLAEALENLRNGH